MISICIIPSNYHTFDGEIIKKYVDCDPFLNEKPKHQNVTNTKYSPCSNCPQKSTLYN